MSEDFKTMSYLNSIFLEKVKSPTGCAAKWFQSTLHLQNGFTQSCYNTPEHRIDLQQVQITPRALHNTVEKSFQRAQMKEGKRPKGCEYCWRIEDQNSETLSDRHRWNAYLGKDVDANQILKHPANHMFNPKFLEVSFSNLCSFMCGYCHPKNSSRYYNEIKTFGTYKNVTHDCDIHFLKIYEEDENPYLKAFWEWWPELSKDLLTLRLTGGEPMMQKSTKRLFEALKEHPRPTLELGINSNLGLPEKLFQERCLQLKDLLDQRCLRKIHVYTSMDTWGKHAEYIRHGLDLELFKKNCEFFLELFPVSDLSFMVTFNIFSYPKFPELMAYVNDLKKRHNYRANRIRLQLNLLTEPMIYSYLLLPKEFVMEHLERAEAFARENFDPSNRFGFNDLMIHEIQKVKNDYLLNQLKPSELKKCRKQFLAYFRQHDERRGTNLLETFPEYRPFVEAW